MSNRHKWDRFWLDRFLRGWLVIAKRRGIVLALRSLLERLRECRPCRIRVRNESRVTSPGEKTEDPFQGSVVAGAFGALTKNITTRNTELTEPTPQILAA